MTVLWAGSSEHLKQVLEGSRRTCPFCTLRYHPERFITLVVPGEEPRFLTPALCDYCVSTNRGLIDHMMREKGICGKPRVKTAPVRIEAPDVGFWNARVFREQFDAAWPEIFTAIILLGTPFTVEARQ